MPRLGILLLTIALAFTGYLGAEPASVRDCSVDLITICIPAQFPYPKILKRRDLPAAFRLRLLSDGRVAEVIVDRSSVYAGLDENAAKGSINQKSPVADRAISIRKP